MKASISLWSKMHRTLLEIATESFLKEKRYSEGKSNKGQCKFVDW